MTKRMCELPSFCGFIFIKIFFVYHVDPDLEDCARGPADKLMKNSIYVFRVLASVDQRAMSTVLCF